MEEALKHRFLPKTVYHSPALLSDRGVKLVGQFAAAEVATVEVSARQFRAVADTKTPQGILGVFDQPDTDIEELFRTNHRRVLLCESVADPGNLGTLARSALAFGFKTMLLTGSSADPYSPKVVRSSAGAVFGLRIGWVSRERLFELVTRHGFKLVASSTSGTRDIALLEAIIRSGRLILAIGAEADGLTKEVIEHSDLQWRIDHDSAAESLNAAVAGSIIMKQVYDNWR